MAPGKQPGKAAKKVPPNPTAGGRADTGAVGDRLVRVIDRHVSLIETRLMEPGAPIEEKDSRILANLAKTLTTLAALDRGRGAGATSFMEPVDREALDADLARRIERWARGGAESE